MVMVMVMVMGALELQSQRKKIIAPSLILHSPSGDITEKNQNTILRLIS